jgi:hypothetical protein
MTAIKNTPPAANRAAPITTKINTNMASLTVIEIALELVGGLANTSPIKIVRIIKMIGPKTVAGPRIFMANLALGL